MPLFGPPDIEKEKRNRNVKGLIKILESHQDNKLQLEAVTALGEIGNSLAVDPLIQAIKSDLPVDIRSAAATALGKIGDPRAVEPLIPITFEDPDRHLSLSAALALEQLGWNPTGAAGMKFWILLSRRNKISSLARELAANKEIGAIQILIDAFGNGVDEDINQALLSFGDLALEPLLMTLQDHNMRPYKRSAAAYLLGELKHPSAVLPLVASLKDEDRDYEDFSVRSSAAYALGQIGGEAALEALTAALDDRVIAYQLDALEALGSIGGQAVVDLLYETLKTNTTIPRTEICKILAKLGRPEPAENEIQPFKSDSPEEQSRKLVNFGYLWRFCVEKNGNWNHQDWQALLADVRYFGLSHLTDDEIGLLLENEKVIYDNKPLVASMFVHFIGDKVDSLKLGRIIASLGERSEPTFIINKYYNWKNLGVSLNIRNPSGRLVTLFYYAEDAKNGWTQFQGDLPYGILFSDTQKEVDAKIAKNETGLILTPAAHFSKVSFSRDYGEIGKVNLIRLVGFYEPETKNRAIKDAQFEINDFYEKEYLAGKLKCETCHDIIRDPDGVSYVKRYAATDYYFLCARCTDRHFGSG
ncbi:MAG: HEAT repeat domain-containing protein [Anaerolineaceae bacterium]